MTKLSLPHPTDIEYFLEVAHALNISRAAERIGISQPSLSLSIQRLEHSMGASLLVRSKKGVQLTPAGKNLMDGARVLLDQWKTLSESSKKRHSELAGHYTIGCHPSVAQYTLPHFFPDLLLEHPDLNIQLQHGLSRYITEQVISLKTDLGIVVNPVRHPDLVITPLLEDEVTFWVGPQKNVNNDYSGGAGVLLCDPDLLQTQSLVKKLKAHEIEFKRVLPSSNLDVITTLVASGSGIGVLPGRVAQRVPNFGLKKVPGAPVFKDKIALIYRSESRRIPSFQKLTEIIKKHLNKH